MGIVYLSPLLLLPLRVLKDDITKKVTELIQTMFCFGFFLGGGGVKLWWCFFKGKFGICNFLTKLTKYLPGILYCCFHASSMTSVNIDGLHWDKVHITWMQSFLFTATPVVLISFQTVGSFGVAVSQTGTRIARFSL